MGQIPQLPAGCLWQQVVGDPHAEVAAAGEMHDGGVPTDPGPGPEAAEHAAESERSRRRQQYVGGVARVVADDLPAGRSGVSFGVSEGGDGRAVKDR